MNIGTFNGWKLKGRVVMAGEKGIGRNEYGDMMFTKGQTTLIGGIERITVIRDNFGRFVKQTTVITTY
jgi:hypothetical protein